MEEITRGDSIRQWRDRAEMNEILFMIASCLFAGLAFNSFSASLSLFFLLMVIDHWVEKIVSAIEASKRP